MVVNNLVFIDDQGPRRGGGQCLEAAFSGGVGTFSEKKE